MAAPQPLSAGLLPSSLAAGFPALPPACLYTLHTTAEELERFRERIGGPREGPPNQQQQQQQQQQSNQQGWGPSPEAAALERQGAPRASVRQRVAATPQQQQAEGPPSPQQTVTHTCVVFSRWTSYKSILSGKSRSVRPGDQGPRGAPWCPPPDGFEGGGPQPQLPGCLIVSKEEGRRRLEAYAACLHAGSEQQQAAAEGERKTDFAAAAARKPDRQQQADPAPRPHTSLGLIMRELPSLDPAEFLLLHSRMQAQLEAVSRAAASPIPLPPSSSSSSSSGADEAWLSHRMQQLAVEGRLAEGAACKDSARGGVSSSSWRQADRKAATNPRGKHTTRMPTDFTSSSSSSSSGSGRRCGGVQDCRQGKGGAGGCCVAGEGEETEGSCCLYDAIGNEKGRRYYLRDSLSARYWDGLLLDSASWYEMTIEPIAAYIAAALHAHSALQRELEANQKETPSFPHLCCSSNSNSNNSISSSGSGGRSSTFPTASSAPPTTAGGELGAEKEACFREKEVARQPRRRPIVAADGCCGAGGDLRQLSRHFDLVVGVDPSLLKIALCRHNCQLLAREDSGCAPVLLLHQQLQQLAAFRNCWSTRDPTSILASRQRLSLHALTQQQEAINGCSSSSNNSSSNSSCNSSSNSSSGDSSSNSSSSVQPASKATAAQQQQQQQQRRPRAGEGDANEAAAAAVAAADIGGSCAFCVPFSPLPCRFCMHPSAAVEGLLRSRKQETGNETERETEEETEEGTEVEAENETENEAAPQRQPAQGDQPAAAAATAAAAAATAAAAAACDAGAHGGGALAGEEGAPFSPLLPIDWLYMSPPWGGENYEGCRDFLRSRYFTSNHESLLQLVAAAAKVAPNVCLFLPRSTDLHELFVAASLLSFPLIEVEVLFLPSKQQTGFKGGSSLPASAAAAAAEALNTPYPKAVIVYLVREVRAWVEGRGLPTGASHALSLSVPSKGWLRADGRFLSPSQAAGGVAFGRRKGDNSLDFAFCPLLARPRADRGKQERRQAAGEEETEQLTADVVLRQGDEPSLPLSFDRLVEAVAAAMRTLATSQTQTNPSPSSSSSASSPSASPSPSSSSSPSSRVELAEAALHCGCLSVGCAAFSAFCGEAIRGSLCSLEKEEC
ncbi:hypothetical protein Efla_005470 [Eimeria flavescens]